MKSWVSYKAEWLAKYRLCKSLEDIVKTSNLSQNFSKQQKAEKKRRFLEDVVNKR